jgi:hypothetical protein
MSPDYAVFHIIAFGSYPSLKKEGYGERIHEAIIEWPVMDIRGETKHAQD